MNRYLTIQLAGDLTLKFKLESTPITVMWLERMTNRGNWPLDDSKRFYGFDDVDKQRMHAHTSLLECIDIINSYQPIISQSFTSIDDQDYLNYLHSIFEKYHGLLNKQNTSWWVNAPLEIKRALAKLNVLVHRAESVARGGHPRFVCTWWGMPKDKELTKDVIERYGVTDIEFGGVYLHYVDVGKTLEDLAQDNDQYISADAFKPFVKYSADFCVNFYNESPKYDIVDQYFYDNRFFFYERDIQSPQHYLVKPYRYKLAQLETDLSNQNLLDAITSRQEIIKIYFS